MAKKKQPDEDRDEVDELGDPSNYDPDLDEDGDSEFDDDEGDDSDLDDGDWYGKEYEAEDDEP